VHGRGPSICPRYVLETTRTDPSGTCPIQMSVIKNTTWTIWHNTNNEESNNKDNRGITNEQQPNSNNKGDDSTRENSDKENINVQNDDTTQESNDNANESNENNDEKGNGDESPATIASPGHKITVMQTFTIEFNI
jgi:hypothetical protein